MMSVLYGRDKECVQNFGWKCSRSKLRLEDNIKLILRKQDCNVWIEFIWLGIGIGGWRFYGNETTSFIKGLEKRLAF